MPAWRRRALARTCWGALAAEKRPCKANQLGCAHEHKPFPCPDRRIRSCLPCGGSRHPRAGFSPHRPDGGIAAIAVILRDSAARWWRACSSSWRRWAWRRCSRRPPVSCIWASSLSRRRAGPVFTPRTPIAACDKRARRIAGLRQWRLPANDRSNDPARFSVDAALLRQFGGPSSSTG